MGESDVVCTAMNAGVLDGLITVFHTERSADSLANLQNDLPILCPEDKAALEVWLAFWAGPAQLQVGLGSQLASLQKDLPILCPKDKAALEMWLEG